MQAEHLKGSWDKFIFEIPENSIISTKAVLKKLLLKNGASNGIRLEKYCVEFAELTIHETELMENVSRFVYGKL